MTPANDTAANPANRPDHRIKVYQARHGLIWTATGGSVRTVTEAEAALPAMVDLALTERSEELASMWLEQLSDLVTAIRHARQQGRAADGRALQVAA